MVIGKFQIDNDTFLNALMMVLLTILVIYFAAIRQVDHSINDISCPIMNGRGEMGQLHIIDIGSDTTPPVVVCRKLGFRN